MRISEWELALSYVAACNAFSGSAVNDRCLVFANHYFYLLVIISTYYTYHYKILYVFSVRKLLYGEL